MQFLIVLVLAAVAAPQAAFPLAHMSVLVRAVIDGDTIDVASVGRVRLLGIDAPELGRGLATAAPFAQEAKDRLTTLVWHRWVRLEQDAEKVDVYNRHLAYVTTEDRGLVNAILVREGLARVSARTAIRRLDELRRAENDAQSMRRGIWGAAPAIPSTSYTRPADAHAAGVHTKKPGTPTSAGGARKTRGRGRGDAQQASGPSKKSQHEP